MRGAAHTFVCCSAPFPSAPCVPAKHFAAALAASLFLPPFPITLLSLSFPSVTSTAKASHGHKSHHLGGAPLFFHPPPFFSSKTPARSALRANDGQCHLTRRFQPVCANKLWEVLYPLNSSGLSQAVPAVRSPPTLSFLVSDVDSSQLIFF